MAETLAVHLNRDGPHAVESQPSFETDGSFSLTLENHGVPAHVYLRPDDALADVVQIEDRNQYVEDTATVAVEADPDRPEETTGVLEVVTGYGAESTSITVTVTDSGGVVVDESLASPHDDRTAGDDARWPSPEVGAAVAVATLAVAVAGALAVTVGDPLVVVIGAAGALLAAGAAAALVYS